jgi:hypothetical protein
MNCPTKKWFLPLIIFILLILNASVWRFLFRQDSEKISEVEKTDNTVVDISGYRLFRSKTGSLWRYPKEIEAVDYAWVRPHPGPFVWGEIEIEEGNFDWSDTDTQVLELENNGNSILATIWPYAQWDQEACHLDQEGRLTEEPEFHLLGERRFEPCDYQAYSNWLSKVVERYDGDGIDDMPGLRYPVTHWEIVNEPELKTFFAGKASDYVDILKASYESIKEADNNSFVVLGGYALGVENSSEYWGDILPEIDGYFDIATLHCLGQDDEDLWAEEYKELLNTYGLDNEFWITETSVGPEYAEKVSHDDEIIAVANAFANGASKLFIGSPFMMYIDGFLSVQRLSETSVLFNMSEGVRIYALWENAKLPLNIDVEDVIVVDGEGKEKIVEIEDVSDIIDPVLVKIDN